MGTSVPRPFWTVCGVSPCQSINRPRPRRPAPEPLGRGEGGAAPGTGLHVLGLKQPHTSPPSCRQHPGQRIFPAKSENPSHPNLMV